MGVRSGCSVFNVGNFLYFTLFSVFIAGRGVNEISVRIFYRIPEKLVSVFTRFYRLNQLFAYGNFDCFFVGATVGAAVGTVVGAMVGATVGVAVARCVGVTVGVVVGVAVGVVVGVTVGVVVGVAVGVAVGVGLGDGDGVCPTSVGSGRGMYLS